MILASIIIARNPAQYDFEFDVAEPLAYDIVTVPDALDLRRAAEWTGATLEEIRDLNPELRRMTTPVGTHGLKVPLGRGDALRAKLESADPHDFTAFERYPVKRNETLLTIARQFKITRADLAGANNVKITAKLQAGQVLLIPRTPATLTPSKPTAPAPAASAPARAAASTATGTPVTYRVKPGDTLYAIARQFDTTIAQIKQWNQLRSDAINVGTMLTIYRH
jgi:membrane-bound lytic murein transglycosylase D